MLSTVTAITDADNQNTSPERFMNIGLNDTRARLISAVCGKSKRKPR